MKDAQSGVDTSLLRAALATLAEAVTVHDHSGRLLYVNEAAARSMGFATIEEALAMAPGAWRSDFDVVHEDGRPLAPDDLPGRRVLHGDTPDPLTVRSISRVTREARWIRILATPLRDEDGEVIAAVNVMSDVTAVKEAEAAQRLLAEAGRLLGASVEYERTLEAVARLAVPLLADWCGVDLLDDHGRIAPVAIAHVDPAKVELGRRLRERYPVMADAPSGLAEVIRTGRMELVQDIDDAMLVAAARDDEHLELLRSVGLHSALIVPLGSPERTFGALSLVLADRRFTAGELWLGQELARRATTAIENARLFTARAAIARTLQAGLLPPCLKAPPGYELGLLFRAAGAANEVGGDFYDLVALDGHWMAMVGDVAGKGAAAAAITGQARHTLNAVAQVTGDPCAAVAQLNASLLTLEQRTFCTATCVTVGDGTHTGAASVLSAGHPAPYLIRAGNPEAVVCEGPLLGATQDAEWPLTKVDLTVGDALVLYTDGVTDAVGAEGRFGDDRLVAALAGARPASADDLVRSVAAALDGFQSAVQRDDIAMLVLRRVGG